MKFSVIVPVYNAEKYIHSSIQSVLNQSCWDFEIVLVDDGSTDASGEICDRYARQYPERIRVIHQENRGQLMTRCSGISAARGEYCVFLDADDSIVPDGLQILKQTAEKYRQPDIIIYSFFYEQPDGELRKASPLFEIDSEFEGETKKELYRKFFTGTGLNNVWTKAVKKTVFDGVYPDYRNYAQLRCSEDRLHSMGMVSNAGRIVFINEPLYRYRLTPDSVSRTYTPESVSRFNTRVLYEEELNYLSLWKLELPEWKQRMDAGWLLQTWYILDLCFTKCRGRENRNRILECDWCGFVPQTLLREYEENPYLNDQQKSCWRMLTGKEYPALKRYFFRKRIRSVLKMWKRKLQGRGN